MGKSAHIWFTWQLCKVYSLQVVPRRQLLGLSHAVDADVPLLGHLLNVARKVAESEKLTNGYRVGKGGCGWSALKRFLLEGSSHSVG